ncbi:MAG: AAA family ATPase [Pseudomonadota bacterium]
MALAYDRIRHTLTSIGLAHRVAVFEAEAIDDSLIDDLSTELLDSVVDLTVGEKLRILAAFGLLDAVPADAVVAREGGALRTAVLDDVLAAAELAAAREVFVAAGIVDALLPVLDDDHLKAIPVPRVGDRARFLRQRDNRLGPDIIEARLVTSLCWDIAQSTMLEDRVGTAAWMRFLGEFRSYCNERLIAEGGYHLHYAGDGQVLIFGYPKASEHDAVRAVRAALNILRDMPRAPRPPGADISVRIGVATGEVHIDRGAAKDGEQPHAVGTTVNLSARLQQDCAGPNSVVVTNAIRRQVDAHIELASMGVREFKGFARSMEIWTAVGEQSSGARLTGQSNGRDNHLTRLSALWKQAHAGSGSVVLMSGEAGIGKSHLMLAAAAEFSTPETRTLELHCSPFAQHSVLHPLVQHLAGEAGLDQCETTAARLSRLAGVLALDPQQSSDEMEAVAKLFGVSEAYFARHDPAGLTPQRSRLLLLRQMERYLLRRIRRAPTLMLCEDLHWADATTLELLQTLFPQVGALKALVLATTRTDPERAFPDQPFEQSVHDHVEELILDRLSDAESTQLAVAVAGGAVSEGTLEEIVFRAEGNPLFVEELTRFLMESPETLASVRDAGLPGRLRELLQARIDGLGQDAVRAARAGAILGRTLSRAVLSRVDLVPALQLEAGLKVLCEAGLLQMRDSGGDSLYTFKHALVRDAAYRSWPRGELRDAHRRVAEVLMSEFSGEYVARSEVIARHYSEARDYDKAARHWLDAGRLAAHTSSHHEARRHLEHGLRDTRALDSARDEKLELDLLVSLGPSVVATAGYTSKDAEEVLHEALDLSRRVGSLQQRFGAMRGLWAHYIVASDLNAAIKAAASMLELAEQEDSNELRMESHRALGQTHTFRGELFDADQEIRAAIALYDPARHVQHPARFGNESLAVSYSYMGWISSLRGLTNSGIEWSQKAIQRADEVGHAFTSSQVGTDALHTRVLRREVDIVQSHGAATMRAARDQGFPFWADLSQIFYAWARFWQDRTQSNVTAVNDALRQYLSGGAVAAVPWCRTLTAEVLAEAGRTRQALAQIEQAVDHLEHTNERSYEAEIRRVHATLVYELESDSALARVTDMLRVARARASAQGAVLFELRSVNSLAQLALYQGRRGEARDLLAEIEPRIAEGRDTPDFAEYLRLAEQAEVG